MQSHYLQNYAQAENWLQFSTHEYLEVARTIARQLGEEKHDLSQFGLAIDNPEHALEEWNRFIEWRQEQLNQGHEIEFPNYYQPNQGEISFFYCSPQNFTSDTTCFVYSNTLNAFPNECVTDLQDANRFEIPKQQHGVLNGMTYNMPKSKIGRSCAVYVVGPESDFSTLIPQVTLSVAKLDHAFICGTFSNIVSNSSNKGKEREIEEIFSSGEDTAAVESSSNSQSSSDSEELNPFWGYQQDDGMMDWLRGEPLHDSTDFLRTSSESIR